MPIKKLTRKERDREHLTKEIALQSFSPEDLLGKVRLFKHAHSGGPWPGDIAAHSDKIDDERGIPRARLCRRYK